MLNWFGRFVLTSTALAPISLVYAWAALVQEKYVAAAGLALAAPILLWLCVGIIRNAQTKFERTHINPAAAEATDRESVGLLVLYLVPLFTDSFTTLQWWVIIPSLIALGFIVSTGYNFYFSPLLGMWGWHSYRITDQAGITYVIITKRQLRSALQKFEVVQLTEYLLLETQRTA